MTYIYNLVYNYNEKAKLIIGRYQEDFETIKEIAEKENMFFEVETEDFMGGTIPMSGDINFMEKETNIKERIKEIVNFAKGENNRTVKIVRIKDFIPIENFIENRLIIDSKYYEKN